MPEAGRRDQHTGVITEFAALCCEVSGGLFPRNFFDAKRGCLEECVFHCVGPGAGAKCGQQSRKGRCDSGARGLKAPLCQEGCVVALRWLRLSALGLLVLVLLLLLLWLRCRGLCAGKGAHNSTDN
jgi:hypothetical protein